MIVRARTVTVGLGCALAALATGDSRAQQPAGPAGRVAARVPSGPRGVEPGREDNVVNPQEIGARSQELRRTIRAGLDRLQGAVEQTPLDRPSIRKVRDELAKDLQELLTLEEGAAPSQARSTAVPPPAPAIAPQPYTGVNTAHAAPGEDLAAKLRAARSLNPSLGAAPAPPPIVGPPPGRPGTDRIRSAQGVLREIDGLIGAAEPPRVDRLHALVKRLGEELGPVVNGPAPRDPENVPTGARTGPATPGGDPRP